MSRTKREMVIDFTLGQIEANGKTDLTTPEIKMYVENAIPLLSASELDVNDVVREVETLISVSIDRGYVLYGEDHVEWIKDRQARPGQEWSLWKRYEQYLAEQKRWAPGTLKGLDDVTDEILGGIEDPEREGSWDNRGMVVGQVQSGKTANYTGLIAKALDTGYKLVIILTGIHNNLRSQTQIRIDEGILGIDTNKTRNISNDSKYIGVGLIPSLKPHIVQSLTTSAEKGDFLTQTANSSINQFGNDPLILTVKKNKTVLNAIYQWALSTPTLEDGARRIDRVPLLLIDDEADFASVNTKDNSKAQDADEVSVINGKIRDILTLFKQSSYVAYTATPFANIFIDALADNKTHGKDLFPKNFIISLPAPSSYVGPEKVFGVDDGASLEEAIVRPIDDYSTYYPLKHKKELVPGGLPGTLRTAILSFILTCRLREISGQGHQHNSMLVHVSRFVAVQNLIADDINEFLDKVRAEMEYGNSSRYTEELIKLWETDYHLNLAQFAKHTEIDDIWYGIKWKDIRKGLLESTRKITVKRMNGSAKDALSYFDNQEKGLSVIAIGGDKLSRGLTLEGLSVSYFLRTTKTYDTLMQMGRWFGYRPGYLHLCRLYTTEELVDSYKHIAVATLELNQQFIDMAQTGATPLQYGLRVMSHPAGLLLVTAKNKMRTGEEIKISYALDLVETKHFDRKLATLKYNLDGAGRFIENLDTKYSLGAKENIWVDVEADNVVDYLKLYRSENPYSTSAAGDLMAKYIEKQSILGELISWTVVLMGSKSSSRTVTVGGHDIGAIYRKSSSKHSSDVYSLNKGRLGSATDESIDLNPANKAAAYSEMIAHWSAPTAKPNLQPPTTVNNGEFYRKQRASKNGLLLIYLLFEKPEDGVEDNAELPYVGLSVSFPRSDTTVKVSYLVNSSTYYDHEDDEVEE